MFSPRLSRQLDYLTEEGQLTIEKNKVVIVGGETDDVLKDVLMQHVLIGSKNITILTDGEVAEDEHWFGAKLDKGSRAHALKKILEEKYNEKIKINAIGIHGEDEYALQYINNANVIFECSNNPYSKGVALRNKSKVPVHLLSAANYGAGYRLVNTNVERKIDDSFLEEFAFEKQSGITGMLIAGFAMQNYIADLKFGGTKTYKDTFWYRLDSESPFQKPEKEDNIIIDPTDLESVVGMVVGQGAVGTAGVEMLARMGMKKGYLLDGDVIEDVNRHAQAHYLFLDEDIQLNTSHKNVVCSKRINKTYGSSFEPRVELFDFETDIPSDVNVVFSYVDRIFARAVIDSMCYNKGIAQIYGSTSADAGSSALSIEKDYYGDLFPSMDQFFLLDNQVPSELEVEREVLATAGCGRQTFPSLVPVNFIVGAMSAHMLPFVVNPSKYGYPFRQVRKYNINEEEKLFTSNFEETLGVKDHKRLDNLKEIQNNILGDYL